MRHCTRHLASLAAVLALTGTGSPVSAALVQYYYLGNSFTDIANGFPVSRVSIWFMADDTVVTPNSHVSLDSYSAKNLLDYSFSNGYHVLSNNPANDLAVYTSASVSFDTDADGNISGNWNAHAGRAHGNQMGLVLSDFISSTSVLDSTSSLGGYSASVAGDPGVWARVGAGIVPLPGGLLLFGSSMMGVCLQRRLWSKRKVAV